MIDALPCPAFLRPLLHLKRRSTRAFIGAAICLCHLPGASAQEAFKPSSAFAQAGSAHGTRTLTAGLTWDLPYRWTLGTGALGSYLEASYAYWNISSQDRAGLSQLSQLAVVPVLRWRPDDGASPWFAEAGVGLTATSSVYRTRQKSFSTSFNLGTHLAIGRSFGDRREHEIALRIEHFSNAGIKHPNPGENFIQLRYARRF
jgi:lipid A 3-O-deacylase